MYSRKTMNKRNIFSLIFIISNEKLEAPPRRTTRLGHEGIHFPRVNAEVSETLCCHTTAYNVLV